MSTAAIIVIALVVLVLGLSALGVAQTWAKGPHKVVNVKIENTANTDKAALARELKAAMDGAA